MAFRAWSLSVEHGVFRLVWPLVLERPFSSWLRNSSHGGRVFVHPPGEGLLGRFHFWAGVTAAALNIHMPIRVWTHSFASLERIPGEASLDQRVTVRFSI